MVYWDKGPEQYIDVFEADLRLSESREGLEDYIFRFGRKGLEDQRVRYGSLIRQAEWDWAHVFTAQDARA